MSQTLDRSPSPLSFILKFNRNFTLYSVICLFSFFSFAVNTLCPLQLLSALDSPEDALCSSLTPPGLVRGLLAFLPCVLGAIHLLAWEVWAWWKAPALKIRIPALPFCTPAERPRAAAGPLWMSVSICKMGWTAAGTDLLLMKEMDKRTFYWC